MSPSNGLYTKFPNVVFELFDIFNLLDSERAFFTWFYSEYHYKSAFIGSIRDLAELARRSKSATDRIVKRLAEVGFFRMRVEGRQTIIEIEMTAIWAWNKVASMGQTVPPMGQTVPPMGQTVPPMGQTVPPMGQHGHANEPEKPVHEIGINSNKDRINSNKDRMIEVDPSDDPSLSLSLENNENDSPPVTPEETLLSWLKDDHVGLNRDTSIVDTHLQALLPHVTTKERAHDLFTHTRARIHGNDPTVWIKNMVTELDAWLQTQHSPKQEDAPPADQPPGMNHEEADKFAQWLMNQPGLSWEIVALDQHPNADIWYTCLVYGPGEGDVLYFESRDHYFNCSKWEQERIQDACIYAASFQKEAMNG